MIFDCVLKSFQNISKRVLYPILKNYAKKMSES
jgi:hypothetical protein